MYADYAYYKDSFGGDLTAEEFNRYARKAERFLNYVIMGEIPEVTEQVKNAVCAAAEAVAEIRGGVEAEKKRRKHGADELQFYIRRR